MTADLTLDQYFQRRFNGSLRSLTQKRGVKTYTEAVLTLLAVTFFIFFAITPTVKTISRLYREIQDKQEILIKLEAKVDSLAKAETILKQLEPDKELIYQALPDNPQIEMLGKQIEALGKFRQVEYQSVNYGMIPLKGDALEEGVVDFSISLDGEYPVFKEYLNSLENINRLITIDGFNINKPKAKKQEELATTSGQLVLTVKAKAHYLKEVDD